MSDVARTPDDRFDGLPDWPYEPRYVDVDVGGTSLRLARMEAGDPAGHPVVLLHGEPTWGYLYRHVVGPLADAGLRAVVPDHPGFGRSDKPTDRAWYDYDRMVSSFDAHVAALELPAFTLVVHDWGGPIGLKWAIDHPDRVARLVILDTALYAPGGTPSPAWQAFRSFVAGADELPVSALVDGGTARDLDAAEKAAYDAPFHTRESHAGALALPLLVPLDDDDPGADAMWHANQALTSWDRPTLILWGADDAILPARIGQRWARTIPGSVGIETFTPASHFLQEDVGAELGRRIAAFVAG